MEITKWNEEYKAFEFEGNANEELTIAAKSGTKCLPLVQIYREADDKSLHAVVLEFIVRGDKIMLYPYNYAHGVKYFVVVR